MKYKLHNNDEGKKLTNFLCESINGVKLSDVKKQLKQKEIKLNGKRIDYDCILNAFDTVEIFLPANMIKEEALNVIFRDENIVAVYKTYGLDTEHNLKRAVEKTLEKEVFSLHRLDTNTEGIVLFAFSEEVAELLKQAIKERKIRKFYRALLLGVFNKSDFTASAYLIKNSDESAVIVTNRQVAGAKEIVTRFVTLQNYGDCSEAEIELITGRTHQIRAHAAFLKHPVLGDGKYGDPKSNRQFGFKRQQLKAIRITFGQMCGKIEYLSGKTLECDYKKFEKPSKMPL